MDEHTKHYIVKQEQFLPTLIVCACGAKFVGVQALALHELHINVQTSERRNVFDQNDKDEESP